MTRTLATSQPASALTVGPTVRRGVLPAGQRAGAVAVRLVATFCLLCAMLLPAITALAATPSGTIIRNIADATYRAPDGTPTTVPSNEHVVVTRADRTPSTITFFRYDPTGTVGSDLYISPTDYSTSGTATGPFTTIDTIVPYPGAAPLALGGPLPLVETVLFHEGDPVFIRLQDLDQNLDSTVIESVLVTITTSNGDQELVRLYETGPDTGIFTGCLPTSNADPIDHDGELEVTNETTVTASYRDINDLNDTSTDAGLFDPLGIVFDSSTGQTIDGAEITLIDASTNQLATVYGDDGVSTYPATVISGASATDSSGRVYTFPAGGYRFPLVAVGSYRIKVVTPAGYSFPSKVATSRLQTLTGAPFDILDPGSRGGVFTLAPVPILRLDIPLDPFSGALWIEKTTSRDLAGIGDFIPYRIQVGNTSSHGVVKDVVVSDRLPAGFRYRSGTTRIDAVGSADPAISADGRTLTFRLGTLQPLAKVVISYIVEVGAGAPLGEAINSAVAAGADNAVSNIASARVKILEELQRSRSIIVGRVFDGCPTDGTPGKGLEGVRLYLENGQYIVTDAEGRYHFEGLAPGTHVVQIDPLTVKAGWQPLLCEDNTRFAGETTSQFVDTQGGTLWRVDFFYQRDPQLAPTSLDTATPQLAAPGTPTAATPIGDVTLQLHSELNNTTLTSRIALQGSSVPLDNLRLTVLLPNGSRYVAGSSRLGDTPLADPEQTGPALTYRLGSRPARWTDELSLHTDIPLQGAAEELTVKALLTFDSPTQKNLRSTPLANTVARNRNERLVALPEATFRPHFPTLGTALAPEDRAELDRFAAGIADLSIHRIYVTGHTDSVRIAPEHRHLFADNFALSDGRARSVANYLQQVLGLPAETFVLNGLGETTPIASNATVAGKAQNRRVEVRIICSRREIEHRLQPGTLRAVADPVKTIGVVQALRTDTPAAAATPSTQIPTFDEVWFAQAKPGTALIWPTAGWLPAIPSTKLAVQHAPQQTVKVLLNGQTVEPLNFDSTETNAAKTIAVSKWSGLDLKDGDNQLDITILDRAGAVVDRFSRNLHYSGPPVRAELVPERSKLLADGHTLPVIAVRLYDRDGYPAREGVVGDFNVIRPYLAAKQHLQGIDDLAGRSGNARYQIGSDGIALIYLEQTTKTGEAQVNFDLIDGVQEVKAWLKPQLRDWILVGLAEGTVGYNTVSGNMESLSADDGEEALYEDGRLAFFAKGQIKGEWLLTMAYDSTRKEQNDLFQQIDPDSYYTLYGDTTQQQNEAPSTGKLYLKIERGQFYALFGDYNTGLTVTELARYSRSLNGIKTELHGDKLSFNAFAAETSQSFIRDEIPGDGTSGLYHLSRGELVLNSEKVTIETRDRFHSEVVLNSAPLTRHIDYDIDSDAGTLYFKQPIAGHDANFNNVYIVVEYETEAARDQAYDFGGRAAVKPLGANLEIGASYIHEGAKGAEGDLTGVDTTIKLSPATTLKAEFADSERESGGTTRGGSAYRAEVQHQSKSLLGRAYLRELEEDFGLGQQQSSEVGTRKFGAEATYRLQEKLQLRGELSRQQDLGDNSERDLAEVKASYHILQDNELHVGLRQATDRTSDGTAESTQLLAGGTWQATKKVSFHLEHEQALFDRNASSDYPTRTRLGFDYRLTETVQLFAEQEFSDSDSGHGSLTRAGLKATPWSGGQLQSSVEQQVDEYGPRVFALVGLKQLWKVTEAWSIDAGLDRSETLRASMAESASEDYTAVSTGATRKAEKWSWSNRLEYRIAETTEKWGLYSGAQGDLRPGLGLLGKLQYFDTRSDKDGDKSDLDIRLGVAWRVLQSRWILLDRLDYKSEQSSTSDSDTESWRVINNLNANLKLNKRTQIALQYGAKYVRETIDGSDLSGFVDLLGAEGRYDLTPTWDVGARLSSLHSWQTGQYDYATGLSVGYRVVKNGWVSVGYNFSGFQDEDYSAADYTAQGPYLKLRFKFDQHTVKEALQSL